ncbi:hypothetical protein V6N12_037365 [Hibiscus sabdariffa]|uniref:Uncharacterized protein n=1 Tax=Hibiscus sabdariffa TaxID=183260 RepID=A0ABR2AKR5_9ROSI
MPLLTLLRSFFWRTETNSSPPSLLFCGLPRPPSLPKGLIAPSNRTSTEGSENIPKSRMNSRDLKGSNHHHSPLDLDGPEMHHSRLHQLHIHRWVSPLKPPTLVTVRIGNG